MRVWIVLILMSFEFLPRCIFAVPAIYFISLDATNNNITFTSPGFDKGQYPPNNKTFWEIFTTPHQTIKVTFEVFRLEYHWNCGWDYVKISEAACNDASGANTETYCGTKTDLAYESSYHKVCVEFRSDIIQNRQGFKAVAESVSVTSTPTESTLTTADKISSATPTTSAKSSPFTAASATTVGTTVDNQSTNHSPFTPTTKIYQHPATSSVPTSVTSDDALTVNITMAEGTMDYVKTENVREINIMTPKGHDGNYLKDFHSIVNINNSEEHELNMAFDYFEVEYNSYCSWDYLTIYHHSKTGPLCGYTLPNPITTTATEIQLEFYSDSYVTKGGFALNITVDHTTTPSPPSSTSASKSSPSILLTESESTSTVKTTNSPTSHMVTPSSINSQSTTTDKAPLSSSIKSSISTSTSKHTESTHLTPTAGTTTPILTSSDYQNITMCDSFDISVDVAGHYYIKSPVDEDGNYPLNLFCNLKIRNLSHKTITIEFSKFRVEHHMSCGWDYVTVYTHVQNGPYCGHSLPPDIVTNNPEITVQFRSDGIIPDKGFVLKLSTLGDISPTTQIPIPSPVHPSSSSSNLPSTMASTKSSTTPTTSSKSSTTLKSSSSTPSSTNVASTFSVSMSTKPKFSLTSLFSTYKPSTSKSSPTATSAATSSKPTSSQTLSTLSSLLTNSGTISTNAPPTSIKSVTTQKANGVTSASSVAASTILPATITSVSTTTDKTNIPVEIVMCNQTMLEDFTDVIIFTEGYKSGSHYPLNRDCLLQVTGEAGDVIGMAILDFNVERNPSCDWDALIVQFENINYKLCGYISQTHNIDFTNECNYGNFVQYNDNLQARSCFVDNHLLRMFHFTSSGSITLRFISDHIIGQKGFKISLKRNKTHTGSETSTVPTTITGTVTDDNIQTTVNIPNTVTALSTPGPQSQQTEDTHHSITTKQTVSHTDQPSSPAYTSSQSVSSISLSSNQPEQTTVSSNGHGTHSPSTTKQTQTDGVTVVGIPGSNNEFSVTMPEQSSQTKSSSTPAITTTITTTSQPKSATFSPAPSTPQHTPSTSTNDPSVSQSDVTHSTEHTTHHLTPIVTASSSTKSITHTTVTSTSPTEDFLPLACSSEGSPLLLKDAIGYIESPKISNQSTYPPNTVCRWKIEDVNGELISLIFEWFDLEPSAGCLLDKLGIYEVTMDNDIKTVAVLCGDQLPQTITSSSDVLIEFRSDTQGEKTGFRLKFLKNDKQNEDPSFSCLPGMTPCWSTVPKSCMPVEWICDGEMDCPDMSDENKCPTCLDDEFDCGGGKCINKQHRCDGIPQCLHAVDELDCVTIRDDGNVDVVVQGVSAPLCHSELVTSYADMVCTASLYRTSTEVSSNELDVTQEHDFALMTITESEGMRFTRSAICEQAATARIKCADQGCGIKYDHTRRKRIIGGTISDDGDWPWTVALRAGTKMICAGTIVDKEWVSTAGHCVKDLRKNPQIASIVAGVRDINDVSAQIRYVTEVVLHPDYYYIFNADIALLKLERPLIFNENVQQICLPWDKREFSLASRCFIAGWGVSNMTNYYTTLAPKYLRHAKTKLVSRESCIASYTRYSDSSTNITEGMMCAGYTGGVIDACKGDSGGGLMCEVSDSRWVLAGIVSWGEECGSKHKPGVYTKVAAYIDWIGEILGQDSQNVSCGFESSDWCGYEAVSNSTYTWTRKPVDKENILYAVRADYELSTPANATLLSPSFSAGHHSCLGFQFLFSSNSNITLSIYGMKEEPGSTGTTGAISKESLLWRITSHYPFIETWQTTETNVPDDITRLKFVSLHDHGGISGLGIDNVTLRSNPCSNLNPMKCNFDNEDFCAYESPSYTMFNKQWKIKHKGKSKEDAVAWAGGDDTTFGSMAVAQLVSPNVTKVMSSFISLPHCLTFSFYKENITTSELKLLTYLKIDQTLSNPKLFWTSNDFAIGQWHDVKVTILKIVDLYSHIVFEVRRQKDTFEYVGYMVDNINMYDGYCV